MSCHCLSYVCCLAASERIVHLRTPKETTAGKLMDLCVKMLGVTDDQSSFTLKEKQGALTDIHPPSYCVFIKIKRVFVYIFQFTDSPNELCPDQQIGTILTPENKKLELYMCKKVALTHFS